MALGYKPLIINPATGIPFRAVHTDALDSVITATGLNAPSGSVEVADGAGGQSWAGLGAYAAGQTDHGFAAGAWPSYLGPLATSYIANLATAVDEAYLYPVAVPRPFSLTGLAIQITTVFGGAGTEVKMGLWRPDIHGWPKILVASGTKAIGAADSGVIEHVINPAILLAPGIYIPGLESRDAGLLLMGASGSNSVMGWIDQASWFGAVVGIRTTIAYAAFPPNPYADTAYLPEFDAAPKPKVWLRGTFVP